ncbi:uncharacterized protein LOC135814455 [Sycon ciliatum]|uniref:uncharacterized protein LOC135814455 n=1 Tax=Sycon ciliatum TaxID=27933 RepID=UPI0020AC8B8F|eukprot:scpid68390/ scgid28453/ Meiotically up-regulated gene 71 protein
MKVVALISGGKDSTYNMMQCVAAGHEIVALANLRPPVETGQDELDSPMFQTVGHWAIEAIAECMGLPLFTRALHGTCVDGDLHYRPSKHDEVEDMLALLKDVKDKLDVQGVSSGAILSTYQRVRVENVCNRLGLTSLAYLWQREQAELLPEMVEAGVEAAIIKVAAWGLKPSKHLGKTLGEIQTDLLRLHDRYQINVCGEGGEYETFTLDSPLFHKRLVMHSTEVVEDPSSDPSAPIAYLKFSVNVVEKEVSSTPWTPVRTAYEPEPLHLKPADWSEPAVPVLSVPVYATCAESTGSAGDMTRVADTSPCLRWIVVDSTSAEVRSACEQAERALATLQEKLSAVNARLCDVCQVQLYVRDMSNFKPINDVYCRTFSQGPPARACVGLNLPCHLRLACVTLTNQASSSAVGNANSASGDDDTAHVHRWHREHLHVQSVSHWASANIGPYSQAVQAKPLVWIAGQIGLVPDSMQLISGGWQCEGPLALRHASRILDVHKLSLDNCALLTVFVTSDSALRDVMQLWQRACDKVAVTVIVQVPSLPRTAEVEWQIVACRGDRTSSNVFTDHHPSQHYHVDWQIDQYSSEEEDDDDDVVETLAVSACVVADDQVRDDQHQLAAEDLAQFLWRSASERLARDVKAADVVQAQLFVAESCCVNPGNRLTQVMEQAVIGWFGKPVRILCAPVQRLRSGFMTLQLLLNLQGQARSAN